MRVTRILAVAVLSAALPFMRFAADGPAGGPAAPPASTLIPGSLSLGNPAAAAPLQTQGPRAPQDTPVNKTPFTQTLRAGPGDTLSGMLTGAGIPRTEALGAIAALSKHFDPHRIKPGQEITVTFQPGPGGVAPGRFLGFTLTPDFKRLITVTRTEDGRFRASTVNKSLTRRLARASGTIKQSLFDAGTRAGLPVSVLFEMVRAYSWDVDFQRDIYPGDSFEIMFERFHDERGTVVHSGRIVFIALTLSGTRRALYRHTTGDGQTDYFDEKGQSARKALLRTPIDGARLSSSFGRRRHPVLGYTRMHRGLDFRAPPGTPIYAAGKGIVEYVGRNGAFGRYVRIRHNSTYSTAYAHMRRFAKGLGKGKRVEQGQIIGYVGSSGRSTGPHLHYEILRGGRQINPLTVTMPAVPRLKGWEMSRFRYAMSKIERQFADLAIDPALAGRGNE